MKKIFIPLIAMLLICGCSRQRSKYGNYVGDKAVNLVEDSLYEISQVYPPAKYRFRIVHKSDDAFGNALIPKMREYGYGISEEGRLKVNEESGGLLDFAYVIDEYPQDKEVRVTLFIGKGSLSRLYSSSDSGDGGVFEPVSYWAWRQ